ncbi:phytoene/squalene synthase family protein [Pseudahrensia aquimaris]|uniref:Phytoene/squalene synthase family protein n=1 Tax=Pseudahrensia aquimaris TaxID=744461 RepID=A0ABW3FJH5_9HYPH
MGEMKLASAHLAECRKIIRHGSKSFYFASLMLPPSVRLASTALYAFCRVSDDIADEPGASLAALDHLRQRLDAAYAGTPYDHAADQAFAAVVESYDIPESVPMAMLEGFEWDLVGKKYNTLSDVLDYSARVASTVGVMMSAVMERRSRDTLARACELGLAMQLINIARDVGEDARNGRCYLPEEWLAEEGLNSERLIASPEFTPALGRVIKRLLDEASQIYRLGVTGISDLPASSRLGVRAAALVYAEIGEKVRANGYNSIDQRAYTTRGRKLGLMLRSPGNPLNFSGCDTAAPVEEVAFLVDACERTPEAVRGDGEWMLDMFAELDRRDRASIAKAQANTRTPRTGQASDQRVGQLA